MTSDGNCIFCKIVAGEVPCVKVLEDETALSFLDIGPLAEGHVLLIPKEHVETVDQMSPDAAARLLCHLPALVSAVRAVTKCEGVNVLQNNGRVAHQFVPHVHFHIIPRNANDAFHFNWPAGKYAQGRAEQIASRLQDHLGT